MRIRDFIERHYLHFNAASLREAAEAYDHHLAGGGKMMITLAGAMSTAELGRSLAEMIRQGKVHAITCTGANLEEDVFNLVAHDHYERIADWRNLTPQQEKDLETSGLNRVTDTCIPEAEAFRAIEVPIRDLWTRAAEAGKPLFPHEFMYQLIREGLLADAYQIDPRDSWLVAASDRDLPIFVPGWEDSTLGNVYVANLLTGRVPNRPAVRSGLDYMAALARWYVRTTMGSPLAQMEPAVDPEVLDSDEHVVIVAEDPRATVGFFQIGGGIAGDFPICVVPMIHQDMGLECPYWGYFCQVSDSTTSYGSYSGAIPREKITWGKLDLDTPQFIIESDATIVAPLIFGYLLDW